MKVVTRTDEYTIFKKRNQRYAVRNRDRDWVRGDDKVAILLAHNLIEAPVPKAPDHPQEPEPAAAESEAEATGTEAGEGGDEGDAGGGESAEEKPG